MKTRPQSSGASSQVVSATVGGEDADFKVNFPAGIAAHCFASKKGRLGHVLHCLLSLHKQ